jgi:hypothetical protein
MGTKLPQECLNPWDEGDYRIYGLAVLTPCDGYLPAYLIERVRGIPNPPKRAAHLHEVDVRPCATAELAKLMAVSHGVQRVRERDRLAS